MSDVCPTSSVYVSSEEGGNDWKLASGVSSVDHTGLVSSPPCDLDSEISARAITADTSSVETRVT